MQIHFRDFPQDALAVWDGAQPLLQAFLNSLKEAAVICAGSAAAVLQMSQQSQQNLWSSVEAADLTAYQRVASSLHLSPKVRGNRSANVPVRLLFRNTSGGGWPPKVAAHASVHAEVLASACAIYTIWCDAQITCQAMRA